MKKIAMPTFVAAIMAATPAYAQSAFVMVIGEMPTASQDRVSAPATLEERIERAVEEACVRPSSRDLKANRLYRECVAELRAELADAEEAPILIAAR